MKITRRDYKVEKTFADLPEGATFVDENDVVAMKIKEAYGIDGSRINAVYFGTGALWYFHPEEEVKEVRAELIVE